LETACRRGEQDVAVQTIVEMTRSCELSSAALSAWVKDRSATIQSGIAS
jgi:hypothetical protein